MLHAYEPPGFGSTGTIDGQPGDRLPGSPQDQGTVRFGYNLPLSAGRNVDFNYGDLGDRRRHHDDRRARAAANGSAATQCTPRLRSCTATTGRAGLYAQNLLNKFAITGVRSRQSFVQTVTDINGDPVHVRSLPEELLRPREIGLKFTYSLGQ